MANEELINRPLIKAWLSWGLVWLMVFPLFGVLVSTKFHNPEFLGDTSLLTFGRLRPVHVNGVIFGAFSTNFLGLLYYYVPRLCGVRLYKEEWGWWLLWLWNAFLVVARSLRKAERSNGRCVICSTAKSRTRTVSFTRSTNRAARFGY